jgi:hypothetical protein
MRFPTGGTRVSTQTSFETPMSLRTTAGLDAAVIPGSHPLVGYSEGWNNRSPDNVALAECLAGHGCIVAAVMNLLKWLAKFIGYLLRTLTFGWLADLAGLLRGFWKSWRAAWARHKLPHPQRELSTCCIRTTHPSVHRPDPCIYSQAYLMQQDLPRDEHGSRSAGVLIWVSSDHDS